MQIKPCTSDQLNILRDISEQTFREAFEAANPKDHFEAYVNKTFSIESIDQEFAKQGSHFFLAWLEGVPVGYLRLNEGVAQSEAYGEKALEIERIYVKETYWGNGYGKLLMEFALEFAKNQSKEFVWLGVWEKNDRAIRLYERFGFQANGTHIFLLGDDQQTDLIMRKETV